MKQVSKREQEEARCIGWMGVGMKKGENRFMDVCICGELCLYRCLCSAASVAYSWCLFLSAFH